MEPTSVTIVCQRCGAERVCKCRADGGGRLPIGWQEHDGNIWCRDCWASEYVARMIVIPIAGPVDKDWESLRAALRICWANSTHLANWALDDLYLNDVRRGPESDVKMPPLAARYQYPAAREVVPEMDPQSVVQLLHWVRRQYSAQRYNVIWTGEATLRTERYPVPYPIHNQSWSLKMTLDGDMLVSLRLAGERRVLRLRSGNRYRRQRVMLAQITDGTAKAGTLSIYRKREQGEDHRPEVVERENGGRRKVSYRTMLGIAVYLPRRAAEENANVLHVRTGGKDADGERPLLTYHVGKEAPQYWYANHALRLCCGLFRRQRALAHDSKAERRRPRRRMAGIRDAQQLLATKYRRALDAVTHEASALIAKYAGRRKCQKVVYDDTDHAFDLDFPWYTLAERMKYKLGELGIEFEPVSRELTSE